MNIKYTFYIVVISVCTFSCQKGRVDIDNITGQYEGIRYEYFIYNESYTGLDSIIFDTIQRDFSWEVLPSENKDQLLINSKLYESQSNDPLTYTFSKVENTSRGNFQVEFSTISFFPDRDSIYMETSLPSDMNPTIGVTRNGIISIGKKL